MLEGYEWIGTFWFNKYKKYIFSGKLSYSPIKGIKLEAVFNPLYLQNKSFKNFLDGNKRFDINGAVRHISEQNSNTLGSAKAVSLFNCAPPSSEKFDLLSFKLGKSEVKLTWSGNYGLLYKDDIVIPSFRSKDISYVSRFNDRKEKFFDDTDNESLLGDKKISTIYSYIKDHYYYFDINSLLKKGFTIDDWLNHSVYELQSFLKICLCKRVYIHNCYVIYNCSNNQKSRAYIFAYYGYNYEDIQEAKKVLKDSDKNPYFPHIPIVYGNINNDLVNSKMAQYKSILDSKDSFLLSTLLGYIEQRSYNIYERLVLLLIVLEQEYEFLVSKKYINQDYNTRYDNTLNYYLTDDIQEIYFNVLRDDEYYKDSKQLRKLLCYQYKNKEYFRIGTVIKYFRDCLVHKNNDLNIKDKQNTEAYKYYSQYWQGKAKNRIIRDITKITSILLFRILYNRIGFKGQEFDNITQNLISRSYQNYHYRCIIVHCLIRLLDWIYIQGQDMLNYNSQVNDMLDQKRNNLVKHLFLENNDNVVVNSIFETIKEYYKTTVNNNIKENRTINSSYKTINYGQLLENEYNLTESSSKKEISTQFTKYLTTRSNLSSKTIKKDIKDFIKKVEYQVYLSFKDVK